MWLRRVAAPFFALAIVTCGPRAVADDEVARLITRAGNAEDDAVRLALLKKLSAAPGLDPGLKADADSLAAAVERWIDGKSLSYFGREVGRTLDYGFKIAEDSPLWPMTCIYRGRMLVWITLESGNIIRYEDRRREFLDKAVKNFRIAQDAFPENRVVGMYLGQPIPTEKEYSSPAGAPRWAALQRENLERLTDIIHWWIDNRIQPDGQYGGGWGDDCEMWRWWAPVLVGFDDPKITAAQARFSEALMSQEHMRRGYTSQITDVEHTAEDSSDVITPMMHLDPDNPLWKGRARRLAELMETLWTGRNERGQLQFKSTYFTVDRVEGDPVKACDTVYHPRALQPALLLWQRTGDERLGRLFSAWMDTWVDAAASSQRGKPAGIVPSAIHWPDGRVGGMGDDWWDPRNHGEPTLYEWPSALSMLNNTLLLTYHMTGEEKYLAPLRSMAAIRLDYLTNRPEQSPPEGSRAWCAAKLGPLAGTLAKYKALTGNGEFDALLAAEGKLSTSAAGNDRAAIEAALRQSAEALRVNLPGYTSEVRYTDRVLRFPALFGRKMMFADAIDAIKTPDPGLLYSLATGDPGDCGYFPLNAVRWLTPPREIAALVTASGRDRFAAELFHFGAETRPMAAELYLLVSGNYVLTLTLGDAGDGGSKEVLRRRLEVTRPVTRIDFELPAGRLAVLSVSPG